MARILSIDPGFAKLGWCTVNYSGNGFRFLDGGVVTTKIDSRKKRVLDADDNIRRTRELVRGLLYSKAEPNAADYICVEGQSWPRSASASIKVAFCWGIIATIAELYELPIIQISGKSMKKTLTGRVTASKDQVMEAVLQYSGFDRLAEIIVDMTLDDRDHLTDAAGIAIVSIDSDIARAVLKSRGTKAPVRRKTT